MGLYHFDSGVRLFVCNGSDGVIVRVLDAPRDEAQFESAATLTKQTTLVTVFAEFTLLCNSMLKYLYNNNRYVWPNEVHILLNVLEFYRERVLRLEELIARASVLQAIKEKPDDHA